jgi:hypothetical protein
MEPYIRTDLVYARAGGLASRVYDDLYGVRILAIAPTYVRIADWGPKDSGLAVVDEAGVDLC